MPPLRILLFLLLTLSLLACGDKTDSGTRVSYWDLSREQRDSVDFARLHHYSINYNFQVTADSLCLSALPPGESELFASAVLPAIVYKKDRVVVAATMAVYDSVTHRREYYVKVARDQETMGWLSEPLLLRGVVPVDPISQFIHTFSNNYIFGFCVLVALSLLFCIYRFKKHQHIPFVHFQDINSMYPTLLCAFTAFIAVIYGTMRHFLPAVWEAWYFDPTLNPVGQPPILALFLTCTWIILILFIASLDEVFRQLSLSDAVAYLLGLGSVWFILYVLFSQTVRIYIGYPLFIAYICFSWRCYRRFHFSPYLCGRCGKPLHTLGRCPHCGTINS